MAETDTVGKPPPKAGEVVNGYRFSGGDPNDKNNWKQEAVTPPAAGDVRNGYRFKGGDPNAQANWVQEPQQPVQVTPEAAAPLPKWGPLTPFDAPNTGVAVGGSTGQPMAAPGSLPPSGPEPPTDGRRFTDEYLNDVQRAPIQGPPVQQPTLVPGQQVQPPVQQAVEAADRFNAIEGEKKALRSPGLMMQSEEGRKRLAGIAEWSDQIAKDDNLTFLQWKTAGDQLAPGPLGVNVDPRWEKVMADYRNVAPAIGDRKTTMTQQEYDERFAAGDLTPAQSIGYNMDALEFQARRLAGRSIKIKDALAKGISPNALQQDMEDVQAGYDYVQGKMAELAKQDPRSFADRVRQAAQEKSNEMKSDPAYQQERMAGSAILGARDVLANTVAGAVRMLDFSDGYSLGDKASDWAEGLEKDGQAALDDQYKGSMLHKLAYAGGQMGGLMLGGAGGAAGKAPIVASALASEFEGYTRQAMADGATQKQAEAGAMLYAPLSAAIELINPQDVLAADGLKGFRGQFIKLVNDGITPKKAMSMAVESAEAGVKESIEELMQTLAERATNAGVNAISGTDLNEDLPTATEVAETVFISTLLGAVAQVPGSINKEGARPRMQAEAMQWAATHPEEVQAVVEKLPEEQRADFTERMDAMAKTYTGNGLTKMSPERAAKISDLIDQKAAVEQEIKDAPMDPVVESAMPEGDPRQRRVSDITKELLLAVQENADNTTAEPAPEEATPQQAETSTQDVPVPEAEPAAAEPVSPDMAEPVSSAAAPEKIEPVYTKDVKDDPRALAEAYLAERRQHFDEANPDRAFFNTLRGSVNRSSFVKAADENVIGDQIAKTYFARKKGLRTGERSGKPIDSLAQELTEALGREVTVDDVVQFILRNPSGIPMRNARMIELDDRHQAIVGKKLNSLSAKALLARTKGQPPAWTPNEQAIVDEVAASGYDLSEVDDKDVEDYGDMSDEDKDIMFGGGSTISKFDLNANRKKEQVQPGSGSEDAGEVRSDEDQGATGAEGEDGESAEDAGESAEEKVAAAKRIADRLRQIGDSLAGGDVVFSSIIPPTLIRQALHFAADVIEKGGEVIDAIARAVAHIRESDWFKSLPNDEVEEAEANIKEVEQRIKEGASGDYTRVQQRRLKADDVSDPERKRILSSTIQDTKNFQKVKEAAKEEFEQAKKDTADLPVLQAVADIKKRVDAIDNPIARTYLLGALHQHVHSLSRSDATTGPEKILLQDMAGQLTNLKGDRGREMGQAIAMYADVYNEFGMFATLIRASRIEQNFEEALDNPKNGVDQKTPREVINEVRKELDTALDASPELKAYLETLKKINAALREAFALQVLAGKKSPLEQPPSLSLMDTFTPGGQQRISDLEETLEKTLNELDKMHERYDQMKGRKQEYAKKINELREKLKSAEAAIKDLRDLKNADAGTKAKLRKQNEQLAASVEKSPGLLQAMKLAQDRASKKKTNRSLIEDVLRVVRTGALWDDDLSSVFADVFALKGFGEQERTMVQHFAYALEYFEDTRQREMADRYTKALNMYLDKASLDITKAARAGRFLQDMLYHHMLSGIGTFFNANGGTTLQAILHSTAGALDHMLRPDGGLGAVVYGARRWAKEHPAALSKALHYTSAFNKAGSMFDTNTAARGSVYEEEVLNGFFRAWDKARKAQTPGGKLKWGSATIAIAASQAVRFGHMMRAMDAYFTHSMVAYRTAMGEYEKMSKELALPKTPLASWGQRLNPATLRKIDEAVGYGRRAREAAGKQADQDIKNLEASGVKVSPGYRTRRVSEILQEQREKEMQDLNLEITRDMLLMGAPDGLPGFGAQKLAKGSRIEDTDKAWSVGRKVALAAILPFMRVTASSINQAQLGIPILGILGAKYGYGKDSTGNWRLMDKGVESPEKTRHRMFVSFLLTSIFLGVMADMFDWEEDEEGGKLVLDPNRNIDLTANAYGNYKLNEGTGEGYQMFSFRKRDGDSWGDYYSTRLLPGLASGMAIAGRLSDDAKGLYLDVPGKKSTPASAIETALVAPFNALGEASFNSVGRAWKKWKYAKDTDQTSAIGFDLLLQPVATAVQPSIYRDAVNIGAMAAGEPASQRRYIDTPEDAMINAAASIYGLDMLLLQDRVDEFGIPVERQDAMRNWMHGLTDEDRRSLDHKEVKLRFSYPGINMPDKRYRPASLDTPGVKAPLWDKDKGKIYLTTEQRDVVDLFSRAAFRKRVLKNYDDMVETAKKWEEKHGVGAAFISQAMSELRNDANAEARDLFFQVNAGKKTLDDMRAKTVRYQSDADKNEAGEKGK